MELLPFIGVAAILVVTPGVDMALVARNSLLHGSRVGLATAIGVNLGIVVWSIAAALGVAAAIRASGTLFNAMKLLGAAYLIYLGIQAWRQSSSPVRPGVDAEPTTTAAALRQGFLSNILNPKIGVFFTAILPPFADPEAPLVSLLVLGAVFNVMGLAWLTAYALVVARGRWLFERPRIRAAFERASGGILVALGLRLAVERRATL